MSQPARTLRQRVADTIARLEAIDADAWVATASGAGTAHLVPLSYAWRGERLVLSAVTDSLTVRNLRSSGRARLGFGPTRDVVVVDAELERICDVHDDGPGSLVGAFAEQAGWDPRHEPEVYVLLVLRPRRIQAWREANELAGKLLMRDGEWLLEA